MKNAIILVMHGAPPNDFPPQKAAELFNLHFQLEHMPPGARKDLQTRYEQLEKEMRSWPRNAANDPFFAGSTELARQLEQVTSQKVFLAFNEFCAPSPEEAFEQAAQENPEQIVVITPMMTRGGEHSEVEIPAIIQRAQERYPHIPIRYIWPFDSVDVARFLATQMEKHMKK